MAFKIFKKPKDNGKIRKAKAEQASVESAASISMPTLEGNSVLKSFYISEKASKLLDLNQYVFSVTKNANKNEIRKQVQTRFKVKVTDVKILNTPDKLRNLGRFSGRKSGFKKAIVTLAKGDSINQVKA